MNPVIVKIANCIKYEFQQGYENLIIARKWTQSSGA